MDSQITAQDFMRSVGRASAKARRAAVYAKVDAALGEDIDPAVREAVVDLLWRQEYAAKGRRGRAKQLRYRRPTA